MWTFNQQPDITGFDEAQKRLREKLGQAVVFLTPVASSYPPGTRMDTETGKPMDPWVLPTSGGGFGSASVTCSVANDFTQGTKGSEVAAPIGIKEASSLVAIIDPSDYDSVKDATQAVVFERSYKVEDIRPDALGTSIRYLAFLEQR